VSVGEELSHSSAYEAEAQLQPQSGLSPGSANSDEPA